MNTNQVKGMVKNIVGKVKESVGILVGSKKQRIKGLGKQISGKAEETYGDVKEDIKKPDKH